MSHTFEETVAALEGVIALTDSAVRFHELFAACEAATLQRRPYDSGHRARATRMMEDNMRDAAKARAEAAQLRAELAELKAAGRLH